MSFPVLLAHRKRSKRNASWEYPKSNLSCTYVWLSGFFPKAHSFLFTQAQHLGMVFNSFHLVTQKFVEYALRVQGYTRDTETAEENAAHTANEL